MVTRGRGAGMRPRETFSCFSYSFSIRFLRLSFFFSLSVKKNGMVMVLHASICSFLRGTGCYMKCVIRPICKSLSSISAPKRVALIISPSQSLDCYCSGKKNSSHHSSSGVLSGGLRLKLLFRLSTSIGSPYSFNFSSCAWSLPAS